MEDKNILEQLLEQNPLAKSGLKTIQRIQDQHIEDAMNQGVPAEHILQQLGIPSPSNQASQQPTQQVQPMQQPQAAQQPQMAPQQPSGQQGNFLYTPFQINQQTGQVVPESILGGLIHQTPADTLRMAQAQSLTQRYANQNLTPEQIAQKTEEANEALKAQGLTDYTARVGAKGQIMTSKEAKGMGSAMINFAEKNAEPLADALHEGDFSSFINADRYTKSAIARVYRQKYNKDITDEELSYKAKTAIGKDAEFQNRKVDTAIHLRQMLDQNYDSQTGSYNIKPTQYEELSMGLASLVSNSNQTTDAQREAIRQRTAVGDWWGLLTYLSGSPQNASSQQVFKNLADSIDRQGQVSEQLRNKYGTRAYGNSFNDYLKNSPAKQKNTEENTTKGFKVIGVR